MRAWSTTATILALLLGCTAPVPVVDEPPSSTLPPPPEEGLRRFEGPSAPVAPGEERFWCLFGTFEEAVGLDRMYLHSDSSFAHHILIKEAPSDAPFEDGEVIDCLELGDWWYTKPVLVEPVGVMRFFEELMDGPDAPEGLTWDDLRENGPPPGLLYPRVYLSDGIAYQIEAGQRFVIDGHYINVSDEEVQVTVAMDVREIPAEDVVHPVGTYTHDLGAFSVPVGAIEGSSFECPWPEDVTLLSMRSHMHSWGHAYEITQIGLDGLEETVLSVPQWEPSMAGRPPKLEWLPGEFPVQAGELLRTSCVWNNTTDAPLEFPTEMCTTHGVGYPMTSNVYCDAGVLLSDDGGGPMAPGDGPG
jgi:hypothetical protein